MDLKNVTIAAHIFNPNTPGKLRQEDHRFNPSMGNLTNIKSLPQNKGVRRGT